jgi:hypothetical protein
MKGCHRLQILFLVFSLLFIEETVRLGLSSVLINERRADSMERWLALNPSDAELTSGLARFYRLFMLQDENKAGALYAKSLELNPLLSSSWLGLTEMFIENGERQKALIALRRAIELAPFYIARLWEGSILALRLGAESMAIENLRAVAKSDPQRRMKVFETCWQLIGDPERILNEIVTDEALPDYLYYLILKDKLDETFPVWKRVKGKGTAPNSVALSYVDFLLLRGRASEAFSVWGGMYPNEINGSLIWNGGFENAPLGRGFDWRIRKADGVTVDFDNIKSFRGNYSLKLEFDGEHNVDFAHVFQILPVEPNADYALTSYMATRNITTRNGIGWEVYCYPKANMLKATESLTGTTDWEEIGLSFHTPSDCSSVVVRLRRQLSNKVDKYISGTAWIDDVKLYRVGVKANAQG